MSTTNTAPKPSDSDASALTELDRKMLARGVPLSFIWSVKNDTRIRKP